MEEALTIPTGMTAVKKQNITTIINQYSKRLMGFIKQRVSTDADAEDILQDVFYQLADSVKPIEQVSGWLFKVARKKITDQHRKQKHASFSDVFAEGEDDYFFELTSFFLDDSANPETAYLRSIFWEELQQALNELPEEQRQVFIQHEIDGVPFKIIAEQTGETVNTLLSRKRYAVLHLRERLLVLRNELLNY